MRIFLAGIMQGSIPENGIHEQDYRPRIKAILEAHVPGAEGIEAHQNYVADGRRCLAAP